MLKEGGGCKDWRIESRGLRSESIIQQESLAYSDTLILTDPMTHGRVFAGMLALPPIQIMKVAAKGQRCAFQARDRDTVLDRAAAFVAHAGVDEFGFHDAVPRDAAIAFVVDSGGIDWTERNRRARVPVLAIGPVVIQNGNAANLAKRHLASVRRRVLPYAAIAAIEAAGTAVVRPAVGHEGPLLRVRLECESNVAEN